MRQQRFERSRSLLRCCRATRRSFGGTKGDGAKGADAGGGVVEMLETKPSSGADMGGTDQGGDGMKAETQNTFC